MDDPKMGLIFIEQFFFSCGEKLDRHLSISINPMP